MINIDGVEFMFSKKATEIDKIFSFNLTICNKRQIDRNGQKTSLIKVSQLKFKPFIIDLEPKFRDIIN